MKIRGRSATLHGAEGATPPLPFIEVDDAEGYALIKIGVAEEVGGDVALVEPEPVVEPVVAPTPAPVIEPGNAGTPGADEPAPVAGEPGADVVVDERAAAIVEVFDILEADDLVKTGARAGKPKVSAIEAATGLTDVTADEVDALFDARAV